MVHTSNFNLHSVQLVAMTPNSAEFNSPALLAGVLGRFASLYDGQPQVLPLPDMVPAEVVRIMLTSRDGRWTFAAAPAQIAAMWMRKSTDDDALSLSELGNKCGLVLQHCVEDTGLQIGRLGLVTARTCPCEHPATFLVDAFCNQRSKDEESDKAPLRHSREFQLHNLKQYSTSAWPDLRINSWIRCKSISSSDDAPPLIRVEQDINTLGEELNTRVFKSDDMSRFWEMAIGEVDSILNLYFPGEGQPSCN